ncbi:MAG: aspartate kinase [Trebouxia sp. A1-2]|nr:MAG: aspartate kinase [Trebouxia sp. A1-2]
MAPDVFAETSQLQQPGREQQQISVVMKFGGSSVASADRMWEVAQIMCSFPQLFPCIVLSAMGKTTNLLLQAGQEALTASPGSVATLSPLRDIKELHRQAAEDLRVNEEAKAEMEQLLSELQQLLVGVSIMQDLTMRAKDSLVSFGERLSTRLFAAFLRKEGVAARQYDAWDLGMVSSDDFGNADVRYEQSFANISASLTRSNGAPPEIPIVTGFLARGESTGRYLTASCLPRAITTLGRGGSDLSATVIGAALNLAEVQVWKDVDGVLTSDPRLVKSARPVPLLTYDEATELAFFGATVLHPQAMQPAFQQQLHTGHRLAVRVKNSYNRAAAGTLISEERDMHDALMTSIVLKPGITLLDIVSTRMLGQVGFMATVFDIFNSNGISVDVVATSEVSISLTLDPSKMWSRDLVDAELDALVAAFKAKGIARVNYKRAMSCVSLICNVEKTSQILERVFKVLGREGINVKMMSQGASKNNISLIVSDDEGKNAVRSLHKEFFD